MAISYGGGGCFSDCRNLKNTDSRMHQKTKQIDVIGCLQMKIAHRRCLLHNFIVFKLMDYITEHMYYYLKQVEETFVKKILFLKKCIHYNSPPLPFNIVFCITHSLSPLTKILHSCRKIPALCFTCALY